MKLSLAGWSLHKLFRAADKPLALLEFPRFTKDNFGIDAVELNSPFFVSRDAEYLDQLAAAAKSAGVQMLNIAVDEKGDLSSDSADDRKQAVANYGAWIPVAKHIGITAIRCNTGGKNITDRKRAVANCIESFKSLSEHGKRHGVTLLIENHWGLSEDADSITQVLDAVRQSNGKDSIAALPDFGNWPKDADRYGSLKKILPYAKAVHAKVNDIDENLTHPAFDLDRCVAIARDAGYDGYLGIEYEGSGEPIEGVKRSVRKLQPLL